MEPFLNMSNNRSLETNVRLRFCEVTAQFNADSVLVETCVSEIEQAHSKDARHYHNMLHLGKLTNELEEVKPLIEDWPAIVFAIAYHDIVYNPLASNNEAKSAAVAEKRLSSLRIPSTVISTCTNHILATKSHEPNSNPDSNYFTDADLSILGATPAGYEIYRSQVRKEYNFYPALIYNSGRKKVLQQFLKMECIYKTEHFREKYEDSARANIQREVQKLSE